MKKILLIVYCAICGMHLRGENQPFVTLFDQCKAYYNPAFTAYNGKGSITLIGNRDPNYHYFYDARTGAYYGGPWHGRSHNLLANIEAPVYSRDKHLLGAGLMYNLQALPDRNVNSVKLNFSYGHYSTTRSLHLGINVNGMKDYIYLPFINPPQQRFYVWNMGAGLMYHTNKNNFFLSISADNLLNRKLQREGVDYFYGSRSLYVMSGIDIKIVKNLVLKPSFLFETTSVPNITTNLLLCYKQRYTIGGSYNAEYDRLGMRMGYNNKRISIHYHYVYALHSTYFIGYIDPKGNHNISLNYTFVKQTPYKALTFNKLLPPNL